MVKELLLLRHGEAEIANSQNEDVFRKLTPPGEKRIERLANSLKSRGQRVDQIIHSQAVRCVKTAAIMGLILESSELVPSPLIYRAGYPELLDLINGLPDKIQKVMLVGHNPTISYMATYLTNDQHVLLSPGMMVRIHFTGISWDQVSKGSGNLEEILQ
ncbi:MAG: histidine phosphatase family protein [Cyclobacteriaceae bacterium]